MGTRGWKLIEWYTASFVGSVLASLLVLMLPQGGWVEFNAGFWMGIALPMALLMVGANALFPRDRPLMSYVGFGVLAAGAFGGLVPLTDASLSRVGWTLAAALVALVSSVLALVFFAVAYELWRGGFPRLVLVAVLVVTVSVTVLTLSDLLGQFSGSLVLVAVLMSLLAVMNMLFVQDAMGWGRLTKQANAVMSRVAMALVVVVGVAILVDVAPP